MLFNKLIITVITLFASTAAGAISDYPTGQLPEGIRPTAYALDLAILPDKNRFSGSVRIDLELNQPTDTIWLHGRNLDVTNIFVLTSGGQKLTATYKEMGTSGVARITTVEPISTSTASLYIFYSAPFNRRLEGLYSVIENYEHYAFTQMEPISARSVFPSFDEPRFKTPFDITLTVHQAHRAISNTPAINEETSGALKRITFVRSEPLPTYLIVFIVGPLDVLEWNPIPETSVRDSKIPLRGIAARGKGEQLVYALNNTADILITLENYFGVPYPYKKLDLIAAPDFRAGAMENAGAIVYRESILLLDENASLRQKRSYARVHAHELAHQWFGNLVTPAWWNDIWLNEAFATWMGNRATAEWDPDGDYERLTLRRSLSAMRADSWQSTRKIIQPIESNHDIANAFDSITYDKGGGVLAMFERFHGEKTFRQGVRLHMERYRFGIASSRDFMQSIADAAGNTKSVSSFISFLNQPGVPIIKLRWHCRKETTITASQSRYLSINSNRRPRIDQKWKIPMCFSYGIGGQRKQTCTVLEKRRSDIVLPKEECPRWILPNADGAGYYRFSLNRANWEKLFQNAAELNDSEILAVLDSLDVAFSVGQLNIQEYIEGTQRLIRGRSWDALTAPMGKLIWVKNTLVPQRHRAKAAALIDRIYGPVMSQLGLFGSRKMEQGETINIQLLRQPLASLLALEAEVPELRLELLKHGKAYMGFGGTEEIDPQAVPPSLSETALSVAAQELGKPFIDLMITHLHDLRTAIVRNRILNALSRVKDPDQARRIRRLTLSKVLRSNEISSILFGSTREPANRRAAWAWFKDNYQAISSRLDNRTLGNLPWIAGSFCTKGDRNDVLRFFRPIISELPGGPRNLSNVLEAIDSCRRIVASKRREASRYFARLNP